MNPTNKIFRWIATGLSLGSLKIQLSSIESKIERFEHYTTNRHVSILETIAYTVVQLGRNQKEAKLLKEILELQSAAIETAYSPEQVGQFKLAVRRLIGTVKDLDVEIKIMDEYFPRNFFDFNQYEPTYTTTTTIVSEEERAELLQDALKETIADTGIDTLVPSSTPVIGADGFDQFGTYHDPNHPVAASERE